MSTALPAVPYPVDIADHPENCRCQPCRNERRVDGGRRAENVLAYAGAGQAIFAGILEALVRAGMRLGDGPVEHGVPWVNLSIMLICVAPKTAGRAQVGKIVDAFIAARSGGRS